ncbi:hypothetical protein GCM10010156_48500 [Planobispora rosea]|uniref:DNA-3-methyladenine glycosylase II n=1 Tax=Planobispora rosea TaxID=35762 RepID=A0A8J3S5J9_PLARO|nr:hypothetical protein [Planobispora rosea]GGS84216.1 hypothetical protein GCM10010156_48500 [Planobispora rosea]GIH86361.1 hypothetical protein Pro02_47690 [Planobispora rosea]
MTPTTWTMLEHPGWELGPAPARALRTPTGTWLIHTRPAYTATLITGTGPAPHRDVHDPAALDALALPAGLHAALRRLGRIQRLRTADLWEALATAIIRQVIRAGQARTMHHALRTAAGQRAGTCALMPTPEQVLALSDAAFAALGMAFKRRPLRAAAEAYLLHRDEWAELPADVLVKALQAVPRIGPWTAGAAVADHTGDFSLYPHADLAVRTWAAKADPATAWPADEGAFAALWRALAGPHLSTLTVLTLAWGDHHAHHRPDPADQGSTAHH